MNVLGHSLLFRKGQREDGAGTTERVSAEFFVDGEPVLALLVKNYGGHSDFMGCFVKGFPEANAEQANRLMGRHEPNTATGRVMLYICPECGDIGCGAYSVEVHRTTGVCEWRSFAYENGYEEARPVEAVGPYFFEASAYETAIRSASAL